MEWTVVEKKPSKKKELQKEDFYVDYSKGSSKVGSAFTVGPKKTGGNNKKFKGGPSIRDLDEDNFEEIKYETVSHVCAEGVKKARAAKDWTQAELAKKINVKNSVIHEIEKGTAVYNADTINMIERATGAKIDRGRKSKKKKKKAAF